MSNTESSEFQDRVDVWYDGSAVCVIVVGSHGDPQDLADHEVRNLINKLEHCLAESERHQIVATASNASDGQAGRAVLRNSWAATLRHLAACRFYLPERLPAEGPLAAAAELEHYLHHNELGPALEAAEARGNALNSPRQFWVELELAAKSMALSEAASRYAARHDA